MVKLDSVFGELLSVFTEAQLFEPFADVSSHVCLFEG